MPWQWPVFNEVLGITNDFLYPSSSKIYEKEPLYDDTSLLQRIKIGQTLHYQGSTVVMWYQECQPLDICKFPTTCSQVQLTPNHQSLDTPTDATQLQHSTVKDCTSQLLIFHHVISYPCYPILWQNQMTFPGGRGALLEILGRGVLSGSPNPDPISKMSFWHPFPDLASEKLCHCYLD